LRDKSVENISSQAMVLIGKLSGKINKESGIGVEVDAISEG
jgi:hypothetical protein